MERLPLALVLTLALLPGCWESHELTFADDGGVTCDPAAAPTCVTRASPCDALELVDAECADTTWSCPEGAFVYSRPWADDRCLPLEGRLGGLLSDGVHESPVPVPLGDRCAWVFPIETGEDRLAAVDVATGCAALGEARAIASSGDGFDYLAVDAAVDVAGETRVLVRGWLFDPLAPFGVRAVGVGLARASRDRLDVVSLSFEPGGIDFGDAAIADGGFLYAYGSPGDPHWLEEDAIVARAPVSSIDEPASWSILGADGWGVGDPIRVFGTGPHRGPVVRDPAGGFMHVYAIGFGREIRVTHAARPEGPWDPDHELVACELPDDPGAYCAGPTVHLELFDPTRPSELVVGYSVGTTSADGAERRRADPSAYWPHVVRVTR